MSNITTETLVRVYDDDHGWFVQVGPDADGLGLCEIRYEEEGRKTSIIIPWSVAERVGIAIGDMSRANEEPSDV